MALTVNVYKYDVLLLYDFLDEIFWNVQNIFHVKSKYIEIQQIFLFLRMEVLMYFDLHHIALKIIK